MILFINLLPACDGETIFSIVHDLKRESVNAKVIYEHLYS